MKKILLLSSLVLGVFLAMTFAFGFSTNLAKSQPQADSAVEIIQYSPGIMEYIDINFTGPISGLVALQLTGKEVITKDFGGGFIAICSINGVGCPADECLTCDSAGRYWGYNYWDDGSGSWQGYSVGAADSTVTDGSIEGWQYGSWGDPPIPPPPVAHAYEWLLSQQGTNGGYSSESNSAEGLLAIGSYDLKASGWFTSSNRTIEEYWMNHQTKYAATGVAEAGKLAVGLVTANISCKQSLTKEPLDYYNVSNGQYDTSAGSQAWAILGTAAYSETIPIASVTYLKSLQQTNGGWEFGVGWGTDTNTTSLAIQALIVAGEPVTSTEIISGLNYLKSAQNTDGGFPYDPNSSWGTASDTDSTSYVVQAIYAAGQDPEASPWVVTSTNKTPIDSILSTQTSNGAFDWQSGAGYYFLATSQAIPALLKNEHPSKQTSLTSCDTLFLPMVTK